MFASQDLYGQEITILDKVTQERIPFATVFSKNPEKKLLADVDGRFYLEEFVGADSVYIAFRGYGTTGFSYDSLKQVVWVEITDEVLPISGMVVMGHRWKQDKSEIPNRIKHIDLKSLELEAPQTAADLLESSGEVYIQKSQFAGGSPQLRGFGTNRVLIMVDGVRMNNAIFRSGNLQNVISIDPNSLESVDVLFGPGAVQYGSDAIGGVMDFKTKALKYSSDSTANYHKTNIVGRFSSASLEKTGHVDYTFGSKRFSSVTTISFADYDDLRAGSNGDSYFLRPSYQNGEAYNQLTLINEDPTLQVHSGYSRYSVMQKIGVQLFDSVELDYSFIYSNTSNASRYDRLIADTDNDGELDYVFWYYGPQEWMMHRVGVELDKSTKIYDRVNINLSNQQFEESRHDLKTGKTKARHQFEKVLANAVNIDFIKSIGNGLTHNYGVEYVHNKIFSEAKREDLNGEEVINSRYPNGSVWQAAGMYYDLTKHFNEKWTIHAGLRYTYYAIQAKFDTSLFAYPVVEAKNRNGALNSSLGMVLTPTKTSQYYLNFGTGFRAPNIDDIGKVFDSEPGLVVVPNANLKPEYAYNAEVGMVKAMKSKVKLDGSFYYTYLKDALVRSSTTFNGKDSIIYEGQWSNVQSIQNVGHAYVYGVQAGLEVAILKGLSFKGTINYQKGFEYNQDSLTYYPLRHVAPLFGRSSLSYKIRHIKLDFYVVYQGEMSADDLPLVERESIIYTLDSNGNPYTPSWYTLNFKAAYFFNKHLSMYVGIENITDQLYRTYGSGISAPGRNFIVSLKGSF